MVEHAWGLESAENIQMNNLISTKFLWEWEFGKLCSTPWFYFMGEHHNILSWSLDILEKVGRFRGAQLILLPSDDSAKHHSFLSSFPPKVPSAGLDPKLSGMQQLYIKPTALLLAPLYSSFPLEYAQIPKSSS